MVSAGVREADAERELERHWSPPTQPSERWQLDIAHRSTIKAAAASRAVLTDLRPLTACAAITTSTAAYGAIAPEPNVGDGALGDPSGLVDQQALVEASGRRDVIKSALPQLPTCLSRAGGRWKC